MTGIREYGKLREVFPWMSSFADFLRSLFVNFIDDLVVDESTEENTCRCFASMTWPK